MTVTEGAKEWAESGVPVFPVLQNKAPATKNGLHDATMDVEKLDSFFSAAWGVGARMGADAQMFAIDLDVYKPGVAGDNARAFQEKLDSLLGSRKTRVHKSQSGGLHYFFESRHYFPNFNPCPGVEIKGEGGYVVVPPSPGYEVLSEGMRECNRAIRGFVEGWKKYRAPTNTIDGLKQKILSAEDFHDSVRSLSAKLSAAGKPPEAVQKEVLDVVNASVAANPMHERHERWKQVALDSGGELSRVVSGGNDKFNPETATQALVAAADKAAFPFLQYAPAYSQSTAVAHVADPDPVIDPDEWPFSRGYFGHEPLNIANQTFVAHPILAESETTLISAQPKAGKTLFSLTLAMHIAAGFDLGTLKIPERRPVLYFALESQAAIRKRRIAWQKVYDPTGTALTAANFQLYVSEMPCDLTKPEVRIALAKRIAVADKWYVDRGAAPMGAIVIDTLTKAMPGADQNSVQDTSAVFALVDEIRSLGVKAAVVFIHHNNKNTNSPRGSGNIQAEPDTLLTLYKDDAFPNLLHLDVLMARSIEDDLEFLFTIEGQDLGKNAQGYQINAPVLLPGPVAAKSAAVEKSSRDLIAAHKYQEIHVLLTEKFKSTSLTLKTAHSYLAQHASDEIYGEYKMLKHNSEQVSEFFASLYPTTGSNVCNNYNIASTQTEGADGHWRVTQLVISKRFRSGERVGSKTASPV